MKQLAPTTGWGLRDPAQPRNAWLSASCPKRGIFQPNSTILLQDGILRASSQLQGCLPAKGQERHRVPSTFPRLLSPFQPSSFPLLGFF